MRDFYGKNTQKPSSQMGVIDDSFRESNNDSFQFNFKWSVELNEKALEYNEEVSKLDPLYKSVQPINSVLVRMLLKTGKTDDNGIFRAPSTLISIPTNAGAGSIASIESPWPFHDLGVIVAVFKDCYAPISAGDMVQVSPKYTRTIPFGTGNDSTVIVPTAYTHPVADIYNIPVDPSDRHYGYILCPLDGIIAKIQDKNE